MNASEQKGQDALRVFYNHSISKFGKSFPYSSFPNFLTEVRKVRGCRFVDEAIGDAIAINEISESKWSTAMKSVAVQGGGRLPSNLGGWISALNNEASKVSFVDAAVYTTVETVKTVGEGAAAIGDSVIATGASLLALAPLSLTAAALFILYRKAKSV